MKRIWNVYQYINYFSKTKFSWPQGAKWTWKYSKNFSALVEFKNRRRAPSRKKQGWIPRRTISWWKASLPPQKENWAFFELPLYIFCLLTVYLNLKCRTLVLKPCHHMGIARQPFCWKWISVTKVSKYGKSEYLRALNASYTFQPLWVSVNMQECLIFKKGWEPVT